jgi:catechol 2,3-dioxygenase-like lactoylglutathione lyase family enzyme
MKTLLRSLVLLLLVAITNPATNSWAQTAPPNEMGVTMDHFHLNVRDLEAHKKFWTTLGGKPTKVGILDGFKFPGVIILLRQQDPTGGTVGSVIQHVGFQVPNFNKAMAAWQAAGLKTEPGTRPGQQGYVIAPDDMRIEIWEEPSLTVPIVNHHIHFFVPKGDVLKIQAWYAKTFGAKPGKRAAYEAADLPGVNLTFSDQAEATAPTAGRVLDHIGFFITDLEAFYKKLEAQGMKFDRPLDKSRPGIKLAFITDPWGTSIEIIERAEKW